RIVAVLKRHLDRYREQGLVADATSAGRTNIVTYIGVPPAKKQTAHVRNEKFTIISNDCWGSGLYDHASLMYRTPFVGTRILAPCYIEMLTNLKTYLESSLEFIEFSCYDFMNERRETLLGFYPIALLQGKVEVHFVHELDEA